MRQQVGTDGADILVGQPGREWLVGGRGDDTYIVGDEHSAVIERQDQGRDTIRASVSTKLGKHVERLELTGNAALYGSGNTGNDRLIGNAGNNVLNGFKGDDSIDGGAGDDTLHGGRGNDRLVGGPGDDLLYGGFGNDVLVGGIGSDTYELRRGMGQDYVYDEDPGAGNVDTIEVTTALQPDDIEVMRDDDDLLLRIRHTTSGIRVANWFGPARFRIEQVRFDDGSLWDVAAIEARVATQPALATDLRFGRGWAAAIASQQQAHAQGQPDPPGQRKRLDSIYAYGMPEPDTITMKRGGRIDIVRPAPRWTQGIDMIKVDAGIAPDDLTLLRDYQDLILLVSGDEPGLMRVRRGFDRARIEFADGTVWDNAAIRQRVRAQLVDGRFVYRNLFERALSGGVYGYDDTADVLQGSLDDDWMRGFGGDDILNGHDGRDNMFGGPGNDRIAGGAQADIIHGGSGNDVVDGGKGADYLDGGPGDDLLLGGSGNDLIEGGAGDDRLYGGRGNDLLYGGLGRDLLVGGLGNDLLQGGPGSDTYYLAPGIGIDTVDESDGRLSGGNTIEVAAGIATDHVALLRDGDDLQLGIGNADDRLILKDLFNGDRSYVDAVAFADGQRWSIQELERRSLAVATVGDDLLHGKGGTQWWQGDALRADVHDILDGLAGADGIWGHAGNDLLAGGEGDDTIVGGAGHDLLAGGAGSDRLVHGRQADIVVFNRGDGHDTIAFDAATVPGGADTRPAQGPTLSLGGVRSDQLALRRAGADLVLDMGPGDSMRFENWYGDPVPPGNTLLQLVLDTTDDYRAGGDDIVRQRKLAVFDFNGVVAQYDRARDTLPGLDLWSVNAALTHHHRGGSDTMALGGEAVYHYAHHGHWNLLAPQALAAMLASPLFGNGDQRIAPPAPRAAMASP
ncbi:calcium-binding protein [Herbaspirillum sp. YR522]|uniref:calcium-binding protein n=1 Tax=Herbaspirillum sp. YR522 TaxID=1144342 RepID=UPI00030102D4|nr:calcium-binding protein [Herbaspirillum sp. YR522]